MGLGEDLGGLGEDLGAVSDAVGGYVGGGPASSATPTYIRGDQLGTTDGDIRGAHPPDDLATHDHGATIEFIHFNYVYPDDSKPFEHAVAVNDYQPTELGRGPNSRAVMYRAALERETILLYSFAASTQDVLLARENALGGVGEVISAVTDLVGGGEGSKAPKASDLNEILEKIKTVGETLNQTETTYTAIHKAGIDLSEARAKYRDFLKRLKENPASENTGLLDNISGLAGNLGGVGEIFSTISGIYTKAFDVYVASYANIAFVQERAIERACREISIQAIEQNAKLVFPVWAHIPEPDEEQTQSSLPGFLGEAVDEFNTDYQKVKDFFATPSLDCPGSDFLPSAFSITEPAPPDQPPPMPVDLAKTVVKAFSDQIEVIPEAVQDIIRTIMEYDLDFVQAIYQKLVERDPTLPIVDSELYAAGRLHFLDNLLKYGIGQSSFLQDLMKGINIQGIQVSPERFIHEALDALNDQLLSKIDPVFRLTMQDFALELEGRRILGTQCNFHTMEVYLGRLPYLLALLFRDTFFPIWDLIVNYVFGPIGGSPLQGFMDSFKTFRGGLQDGIDSVRDYVTKAENVADRWQEEDGIHAGSGDSNVGGYLSDLDSTAQRNRNPAEEEAKRRLPFLSRKTDGTGKHINKQEWTAVNQNHKWESALRSEPPPEPETEAEDQGNQAGGLLGGLV